MMGSQSGKLLKVLTVLVAPALLFSRYCFGKRSARAELDQTMVTLHEIEISCSDVRFYGKPLDLALDMAVIQKIQQSVEQAGWNELHPHLLGNALQPITQALYS